MDSDQIGSKYGKLTVLKILPPDSGSPGILCRCDCGRTILVTEHNLLTGHTKSCGCIKSPDRTGQRFGSLTVVGRSDQRGKRGKRTVPLWECRCDCGATVYRAMDSLTANRNCSCGACLDQTKTKLMRDNAGYVDGTQLPKITGMKLSAANTSGIRGVYLDKRTNRWRARLRFRGRMYNLGTYASAEEAAKARANAEDEIFGAFLEELG